VSEQGEGEEGEGESRGRRERERGVRFMVVAMAENVSKEERMFRKATGEAGSRKQEAGKKTKAPVLAKHTC
jgi:hypothetical protein